MVSDRVESPEKYACDSCRLSKVTCSRQRSGCNRCKKAGSKCVYSRSGVIRRARKRRRETTGDWQNSPQVSIDHSAVVSSHLAADIDETREQLSQIESPGRNNSLVALSSLAEACAAATTWRGDPKLDKTDRSFFPLEEHAAQWAKDFGDALRTDGPLMSTVVPSEVMDHLRAARPHKVRQRAWLVMYYGIILNKVTSTLLKEKLRHNLWLALSDVSVLLEPSEANIRALTLVLSQVSEFTGPSLCWMLATNACRMLEALGVNERRLDPSVRERRLAIFWHLNLLDKGLAIIFGRTPTFHGEMVRAIGLPTLEQIQPSKSHVTLNGTPGFFARHYMYQKILLSHLMGHIWHCLYGEAKPNTNSIEAAIKDLDSWYAAAQRILEAAALSEKPFCDAKNCKSIDVALHTIEFHFLHLSILLTRSLPQMHEQCLDASRRMLHLLRHMAPESQEPYHPIIWQLVCSPFTPLLILYREVVTTGKWDGGQRTEALAAMDQLPRYWKDLGQRCSLAARLEGIARVFVQHARSVVLRQDYAKSAAGAAIAEGLGSAPAQSSPEGEAAGLDTCDGPSVTLADLEVQSGFDGENGDMDMFLNNFDGDGMLDWLSWTAKRFDDDIVAAPHVWPRGRD